MRQKALVTICGAVMAASIFIPFSSPPAPAPALVPFSALRALEPVAAFDLQGMMALPPLVLLFVATFVLGLVSCLLSLAGWTPRLLALLTSLLPVGLTAYCWFEGREQVESLGISLPTGSFGDAMSSLPQIAGAGFWMWGGSAVLLLLIALLDPGDSY